MKINGETHYLWRAVDHEGEVLESYVIKRRDEGHWQRRQTGNGALAQQPGREFTPAVSTKRTGHASVPAHTKFAKVRRRPRLSSQPFQPGKTPL